MDKQMTIWQVLMCIVFAGLIVALGVYSMVNFIPTYEQVAESNLPPVEVVEYDETGYVDLAKTNKTYDIGDEVCPDLPPIEVIVENQEMIKEFKQCKHLKNYWERKSKTWKDSFNALQQEMVTHCRCDMKADCE